jgi:hypothetical protein
MTIQDFFSTSPLEKDVVNRKTFTDGKKVEWLKTCWIRLGKENPRALKMKQTHNEDYPFSTLRPESASKGKTPGFRKHRAATLVPKWEDIDKGEA